MKWLWAIFIFLFLSGGALASIDTLAQAGRGQKSWQDSAIDVGKNVIMGLKSWDDMGSSAVRSLQTDTSMYQRLVAFVTCGVVFVVYFLTFKLLFKFVSVGADLFRPKPIVSKTREKLLFGTVALIGLTFLTFGFGFIKTIIGVAFGVQI